MYHCWNCDSSGRSIIGLLYKIKASREQIREMYDILEVPQYHTFKQKQQIKEIELPKEFILLTSCNNTISSKRAFSYLKSRNITNIDIERYNIGYCIEGEYKDFIIIPSYDSNFKLNYFVGRSINNEGIRYKNPPVSKNVVGFESTIHWNGPSITICEGVFDAIAIRRNAIPIFGKILPPKVHEQIILKNIQNINILLDNDAKEYALDMAQVLDGEGRNIKIIDVPKDKDAADLGFSWIVNNIYNAKDLDYIDILKQQILAI